MRPAQARRAGRNPRRLVMRANTEMDAGPLDLFSPGFTWFHLIPLPGPRGQGGPVMHFGFRISDFGFATQGVVPCHQPHFSSARSQFPQDFLPRISRITRIRNSAFCILHFLIRAISAIRGSIPFVAALRCCVFCDLSRSVAAIKCLVLRFLRIIAAIQSKRLSMNHLHAKPGLFQSRSIKPNQAKSR